MPAKKLSYYNVYLAEKVREDRLSMREASIKWRDLPVQSQAFYVYLAEQLNANRENKLEAITSWSTMTSREKWPYIKQITN